jgi:BirA family transcriptional regulator, biotin operon repressor / biotin---[acetyl-CoA-carboxylase] ligase
MFTGMAEVGARFDGEADVTSSADRARRALAGSRFGDVRWAASTGSTNSDALALARDGAPEGIVVVADHQHAGRGRRARTWVAPPGGSLLVSVLLRPPAGVAATTAMATAVAMAEAVDDLAAVKAGLKWPNDLVVATADGDRKLAGILAEADWPAGSTISAGYRAPAAHDRAVVVVGVGINVTWPALERPSSTPPAAPEAPGPTDTGADETAALAEVAGVATALNWLGAAVDRVDLLVAFLRRLDHQYAALLADGPGGVVAEWRRRSATLGRRVRVDLGAEDVDGTAADVTDDGHLVVETLEGDRRTLAVGDVVHLRPR